MAPPMDNPYVASGSSADIDDTSATTNLYIGNLPMNVSSFSRFTSLLKKKNEVRIFILITGRYCIPIVDICYRWRCKIYWRHSVLMVPSHRERYSIQDRTMRERGEDTRGHGSTSIPLQGFPMWVCRLHAQKGLWPCPSADGWWVFWNSARTISRIWLPPWSF